MDSAARASAPKETFCERCFAAVKPGEAYCPDCGAPTGEIAPAADSAVHGELAQANLLRLRGRLDESEKLLLSVLRRFPNDPYAHEMLGDVCAERDECARAIEWYDLALDLAPQSVDVRRKIDETRQRLEARATSDTAETLGLPPETPRAAWWPLGVAAAVLILAIGIAMWPRPVAPAPLRVALSAPSSPLVVEPDPTPVTPPSAQTTPVVPTGSDEDRAILAALQAGAEGKRAIGALSDPRTSTVTITFSLVGTEDPSRAALLVGKEALSAAATANTVSLHALSEGKLAFVADLARASVEGAEPLSNVWPAAPSAASASPATSP